MMFPRNIWRMKLLLQFWPKQINIWGIPMFGEVPVLQHHLTAPVSFPMSITNVGGTLDG